MRPEPGQLHRDPGSGLRSRQNALGGEGGHSMPRAIIHYSTLRSGDPELFLTPPEFDYNRAGLRLDELGQGAKGGSWTARNREDSVCVQSCRGAHGLPWTGPV